MVSNLLSKMARSEGDSNLIVSETSMPFSIMVVLTFFFTSNAKVPFSFYLHKYFKNSSDFLIIYLLNGLT